MGLKIKASYLSLNRLKSGRNLPCLNKKLPNTQRCFLHFLFLSIQQKSITIAARNLDFVRISMSTENPKAKKALVKLPFPMPSAQNDDDDAAHNQVRPKPEQYADRTWMPPRGTRRSMGKR